MIHGRGVGRYFRGDLQQPLNRGFTREHQVNQVWVRGKIMVTLFGKAIENIMQGRNAVVCLAFNERLRRRNEPVLKVDFIKIARVSQPPRHDLNLQRCIGSCIEILFRDRTRTIG